MTVIPDHGCYPTVPTTPVVGIAATPTQRAPAPKAAVVLSHLTKRKH